jgi:hypothetical protein
MIPPFKRSMVEQSIQKDSQGRIERFRTDIGHLLTFVYKEDGVISVSEYTAPRHLKVGGVRRDLVNRISYDSKGRIVSRKTEFKAQSKAEIFKYEIPETSEPSYYKAACGSIQELEIYRYQDGSYRIYSRMYEDEADYVTSMPYYVSSKEYTKQGILSDYST